MGSSRRTNRTDQGHARFWRKQKERVDGGWAVRRSKAGPVRTRKIFDVTNTTGKKILKQAAAWDKIRERDRNRLEKKREEGGEKLLSVDEKKKVAGRPDERG